MTVSDRIRQRRMELNMSQSELAKKARYSDKTRISKLENAGDDISMKQVRRIATALETTPAYLMGWEALSETATGHNFDIVEVQTDRLPSLEAMDKSIMEKAIHLYNLYIQAPPEIQAAVETLLKATKSDS